MDYSKEKAEEWNIFKEGNSDPAFFSKKWVFDPFIKAMDVINRKTRCKWSIFVALIKSCVRKSARKGVFWPQCPSFQAIFINKWPKITGYNPQHVIQCSFDQFLIMLLLSTLQSQSPFSVINGPKSQGLFRTQGPSFKAIFSNKLPKITGNIFQNMLQCSFAKFLLKLE